VIVASYPIVVTDKPHECRDFYTRWFGLSFTHPAHPSTPPEPAAFTGYGMFLTLAPSGMWVDVVEQTEPAPGWWDEYL
jgi:hypothetical protein